MIPLRLVAILFALAVNAPASAETVDVKYRGAVDLKWFSCTDTPRSSFIRRVCYDRPKRYMLIRLNDTWYHYCEITEQVVMQLLNADSAGTYFNRFVRGGPHDCRLHKPPLY